MKKIIIISIIAVLLCGAAAYYFLVYKKENPTVSTASIEYKFKSVKIGDIIDKIAEVGKIEPVSLVKVKSNVTGTVKKLYVLEGMEVKYGQKVALIKPGREAEQYQESEVLSPIAGLVIEKTVEEGDMVTSGLSELSGGTAIISVARLDRMIIKIDINEVDISSIKEGLPARIKVEAYPKKDFRGKVTKISPQAKPSADGKINVFKTEIEVAPPASELKPGMKAVVEIVLREKKDVVIAPLECVFEEDGEQFVYLLNGETWERRSVKVGLYDDNNIEVVEGVKEKEKLCTSRPENYEKLFKDMMEKKAEENKSSRPSRSMGNAPGGLLR